MRLEKKPAWLAAASVLIILVVGTVSYSNTFSSSFHWDDGPSITANPALRDVRNLRAIWDFWPTRFLTYLSFALNYHLHRLDVWGYHVVNLLIHLGSAVLVWWFTLLTFSTPRMREQQIARSAGLLSLFSGLVFVAHPVQTQGVTYIVQRAASMATLFYLTSLCLYAKGRLLQGQGLSSGRWKYFYGGSLMAAVLSMFTKEMALTLPVMIGLYEFFFFKSDKRAARSGYLIPFLSIIFIIPATVLLTKLVHVGEMHRATEMLPELSPGRYLLTQFRVIVTYIRLALAPFNQNIDYDYPVANGLFEAPVLASALVLAGLIVLSARMVRNYRVVSFGIFWFFITLLPESSVIPIRDVIFEHRLYLPMAGFSLALVSGMYYLVGRFHLRAMAVLLTMTVLSYSALAYARNAVWKDEVTLWNDTVRKSPRKARSYHSRGLAHQDAGNIAQALSDFRKAIEIDPVYVALLYDNRAKMSLNEGNFDRVLADAQKAIEINPEDAIAHNCRGLAYLNKGKIEEAFSDFSRAIELDPGFAAAYNNRGRVYQGRGEPEAALRDFDKALELMPRLGAAQVHRAELVKILNGIARAGKAIENAPGDADAYSYRGYAYMKIEKNAQALADLSKAIALRPDDALAHNNRAVVYFKMGEYAASRQDLERARALGFAVDPAFLNALKEAAGDT